MAADGTRDRLLDAAERLLARLGYQKATMEDLAREAGLGKRTIYLHFAGKEEVMLSTIDRIVERLLGRLREAAGSGGPAAERLRRMLRLRVMFRFDSVRHYYQGIDDLFRAIRPAYMARRSGYFAAESEVFAAVLAEGASSGELAVDDPREAALDVILATNALLPSALSTRELGGRAAVEARARRLADLLIDGLRRREAAPRKPIA
ncbi:MAG: helix-turn-helix domain-containing protein [Isosphaeraceae bacterium]